jgi:molecular chaperone IbpA
MYYTKSTTTPILENMIDAFFPKVSTSTAKSFPPYNIIEFNEGNNVIIEFALAGYDPKDISVYLEKEQLVVEYTKQSSTSVDTTKYIYKGISEKSFKRIFSIGNQFKIDESAKWENGILRIAISKIAKDMPERKIIEIKKN